ncbi:MAG: purine-nucleoside phosphorylase, partial [Endomicrobia bacterium]|nr:purine-nucleoside phosphorylase [Endomicrobiia bacterium]
GFGSRFPDMSGVYAADLRKLALSSAKKLGIKAHEGVYFGVRGPSYETPAEVKAFRNLGGDVAGMSVVYEAITAAQAGIKVLGIAYVSNMAAGVSKKVLSHSEVLETGNKTGRNAAALIKDVLERLK